MNLSDKELSVFDIEMKALLLKKGLLGHGSGLVQGLSCRPALDCRVL